MDGLAKWRNVTPELQHCHMHGDPWPTMAFSDKITPSRRTFELLLSRFNIAHRLTFSPEFHADLFRYKEMRLHCIPYKNVFSQPHFASLYPGGAQISTREIWVRPDSAVKLSVKICRSCSRKSDLKWLHSTLLHAWMQQQLQLNWSISILNRYHSITV